MSHQLVVRDPRRSRSQIANNGEKTDKDRGTANSQPRFRPQTIVIPWRPPPNVVMQQYMTLLHTVACFEDIFDFGDAVIEYPHIESMWNYHQLTNKVFHDLYYKPRVRGTTRHQTDYSYYYRRHPLVKDLMEAHTRASGGHLIIYYIGGSDKVLNMMKVPGPYLRPFVKLYADINSFDRPTTRVLERIEKGKIRVLCFVDN